MPFSYTESTASAGQHLVNVSWPYRNKADVNVAVNGTILDQGALSWTSDTQIDTATAFGGNFVGGETVRVYRTTPADNPVVTFQAGVIKHSDLNAEVIQLLYIVQEAYDSALLAQDVLPTVLENADTVASSLTSITAMYGQINTWQAAVEAAVTAAQGYAASTASDASNTANDVSSAAAEADAAAASATAAAASDTSAGTHETNAGAYATAASSAQAAAEAARDSALAAYANFSEKYLGEFATAPTTNHDGDALSAGDAGLLYFSTESGNEGMKVWSGSAWAAAYVSGTGYMAAANNLSELTSPTTARVNLGLGNVDNTSDANKPVSTATQTALDAKLDYDADLNDMAALSPANDDVMQRKGGHWVNRSVTQYLADLTTGILGLALTGLSTATSAAITAADNIVVAMGKLQAQISANATAIAGKQASSTILGTISGLANASGALTNNGSGGLSWAAASSSGMKVAIKSADETRTSTTTLSNAADLSFPMQASKAYFVRLRLSYTAGAGGMQVRGTGPSSPTLVHLFKEDGLSGSTQTDNVGYNSTTYNPIPNVSASAAGNGWVTEEFIWQNGSNAGTYQLQFCQSASNAAATTLHKGSIIEYMEI